jgi:hypothetical protein
VIDNPLTAVIKKFYNLIKAQLIQKLWHSNVILVFIHGTVANAPYVVKLAMNSMTGQNMAKDVLSVKIIEKL